MGNAMNGTGRILIILGLVLVVTGIVFLFLGKFPGMKSFPGDISIKRDNFTFYFPLGTSILVSILLTLLFFLWRKFGG